MMIGDNVDGNQGYDSNMINEIRQQQSALLMTLAQFQLNFEEEANRFEQVLTGKYYDNEKREYIILHPPIMNQRGIMHIMKKIRLWFSKMIAQSNYTQKEINAWCKCYWHELVHDAYAYGDEWDLEYDEYYSFVHDCVHSLHGLMKSALDAGLRDTVGKISKVVEHIGYNTPEKKKFSL
jgi:hypothetical protein